MTENEPIYFHDVLMKHREKQQKLLSNIFNSQDLNKTIESSLEDLVGVSEAYKDGAIADEAELTENIKINLRDFAANIISQVLTSQSIRSAMDDIMKEINAGNAIKQIKP